MPQLYLVCEGERGSLDIRLLDAVLAQSHGLPVVIEPGGGANNPRIVRRWLEQRVVGDIAILIHDRDYELLATVQGKWANLAERCLFWMSHEIENYLLEPWVLHERLAEYRRTIAAGWVATLPPDVPAIEAMLRGVAPRLFNDHIARTLCGHLRRHKTTLGTTEINIPTVDPLAGTAVQWQAGIQGMIAQLHATCAGITMAPEFQQPAILAEWTRIENIVRAPGYLTSDLYRQEIKGKRLLNLVWDHLRGNCGYPGTQEDFTDDLVITVRTIYRTSPQFRFVDFDNLANRLRVAVGIPPVP
jgi:hypothetical protein